PPTSYPRRPIAGAQSGGLGAALDSHSLLQDVCGRCPTARPRCWTDTVVQPPRKGALMPPVLGEIAGWEFLLVIAVAALLFGSSKIPKLARSLGQASKEFRKGLDESTDTESGDPELDADKSSNKG